MRPLQRARDEALTNVLDPRLFYRYVPVFALKIIWRFARPDLKNLIDRLKEHRVAISVEITKNFRIRQQSARADTEDQAAVEHVIEHRDRRCKRRRMGIRHVDGAGTKLDLLGRGGEPG